MSGCNGGTIKVWDAGEPFQLLLARFPHSHHALLPTDSLSLKGEINDTGMAEVMSVDFSPDGSKIVGGSSNSSGTINVWTVTSWSREAPLLVSHAVRHRVILLLWLNKRKLLFPEDVLDLLINACV